MKSKKKIMSIALFMCMAALVAGGSLAYFTDTDEVTNEFVTQGSFGVKIEEEKSADGEFKDENDASSGIKYEGFVPGQQLEKEPFVTNSGTYDQWVRVRTIIPKWSAWKSAFERHGVQDVGPKTFISKVIPEYNTEAWELDEQYIVDEEADTLTFFYYLKSKLAAGDKSPSIFTHVVIPAEFDMEDLEDDALGSFDIQLVAEAIQSDNTGDNAKEAFKLYYDK